MSVAEPTPTPIGALARLVRIADDLEQRLARLEVTLAAANIGAPGPVAATPGPVLTTREAAAYVGLRSLSAFYAWARRWHVPPCGHGRWAKHRLDVARVRQARDGRRQVRADDRRRKPQPQAA